MRMGLVRVLSPIRLSQIHRLIIRSVGVLMVMEDWRFSYSRLGRRQIPSAMFASFHSSCRTNTNNCSLAESRTRLNELRPPNTRIVSFSHSRKQSLENIHFSLPVNSPYTCQLSYVRSPETSLSSYRPSRPPPACPPDAGQ
jgi:hypothetical protein